MATSSAKTMCVVCNRTMRTYLCDGCSQRFCGKHLDEHRKNLDKQLDQIKTNQDELRQVLNEQKQNPEKLPIMNEIDQWERNAIDKIKQTANQCRDKFINYTKSFFRHIEKKFDYFDQQIKQTRNEDEFNDIDLNQLNEKLSKLEKEFLQPADLFIQQQSTIFINVISLHTPSDIQWKQLAKSIAGGNEYGKQIDQLSYPFGICVDENDQTIFIADWGNARIVEWRANARNGRIVAGGRGPGKKINQLNNPTDVVIDGEDNSFIIADHGNRRVMRWSRETSQHGQIIIADIDCWGLAMHKDGSLYVSDYKNNEVRRWKQGETHGAIVAGGNGQGSELNQFNRPTYIFVDDDHTLYVSDHYNHRVIQWLKDGKVGIVVAGGNGAGDGVTHLSYPQGVFVDLFGRIYVADWDNARVMRWCAGANEGTIVVGGNEHGEQANQLNGPMGLSFDANGNLYVADWGNSRIQKFEVDRLMK